jgi:exodeoxyribonuclease III
MSTDLSVCCDQRNKSPGFTDAERESFTQILESGFVDVYRHLHPETTQYTYWSYRFNAKTKNKGWRLDYFVLSKALLDRVVRSVEGVVLESGLLTCLFA